jgi:hypothetical protein
VEQRYSLGKTAGRPNAITFKLARYLTGAVPTPPAVFGHQSEEVLPWGMLGNDNYGDCVEAGTAHETMLWNIENGISVPFTDATVLRFYTELTGFDVNDPNSDQGTDMSDAVKYRQKTGIADDAGTRHTIGAYLGLKVGDTTELATAAYIFGAVGFGFNFPASAMDQFNAGKPWDIVKGSAIDGGHYVPVVGRTANGNFVVVTWGQLQEMTPAFAKKYMDEGFAAVSSELLNISGISPEGLDLATLNADLAGLGSGVVPAPTPSPVPTPVPTPTPVPSNVVAEIIADIEKGVSDLIAAIKKLLGLS